MSLAIFDYITIAAYFAALLFVAFRTRFFSDSFEDFSLAKRAVPGAMVFASLSATFIGPGYSIALADKGAQAGFLFLFVFSFFSLQTMFTAKFVAPRLREFKNSHSVGDVMGVLYGQSAQVLAGFVSVLLSIGFVAVMAKAGGGIIAGLLDVSQLQGMLIITIVGVLYALTGGLKAVIVTEAFQFVIIVSAISILLLLSSVNLNISGAEVFDKAVSDTRNTMQSFSLIALLGLFLTFFFGEMLIPPYANRSLASRSKSESKSGFMFAGIFSVFWFLSVVLIGVFGSIAIGDDGSEGVLLRLSDLVLPSGLKGLLVVALAAIVMSTQESVLNAGSVSYVRDFQNLLAPSSDRNQLVSGRIATLCIGIGGLALALYTPSIIATLLISYSVWAPAVAIPLVWGVMGLPINATVGKFAMIGGLLFSLYAVLYIDGASENGMAIFVGIAGNLVGAIFGWVLAWLGSKKELSNFSEE
ncbi:MAG: sodium:solute symporter family protein [Candidatus Thiodiazotropha taylori]